MLIILSLSFYFQDGEIDLKLLTNVLSPETEIFEVRLYNTYVHIPQRDSIRPVQRLAKRFHGE